MGCDEFDAMYDDLECETCTRVFNSHMARFQHMKALRHFQTFCEPCGRNFMNGNNLDQHRKSSKHKGHSINCPYCKRSFVTASGVCHHLETGSCPRDRNLNRDNLYEMVPSIDPDSWIPQRQIRWDNYANSNVSQTTLYYWDLEEAWNGYSYECFLCPREYQDPQSLCRHLESLAHPCRLHLCPNDSCCKEFVGLAGLFNHLESGSCRFLRFEDVRTMLTDFD